MIISVLDSYMLRIGFPVIISLVASLFVALVFIPLAATRVVSKREVEEPSIIRKTNRLYQRVVKWTLITELKHRLFYYSLLCQCFMLQDKMQIYG